MENDRNADTAAIALAFTAREESSALESTVAWTVHIISQVCGWNGAPIKGGKKTAIKMARERYGYRVDANGDSILDHKGNRAKRSTVFNRLSLVEKVITYALENEKEWIETIHYAATNPETDPEQRDQAVAECVEQFAARLAGAAQSETIDGLKYYLENGVAKAEAVTDAADALSDGETSDKSGETSDKSGETVSEFEFETVYQTIAANAGNITSAQWARLVELARDNLATDEEIDAKAA